MIEMRMKEEEEEDCLSFILQFTFNSQFQAPLSLSAMYSFPFLSLYSAQLNSFFNDDDRLLRFFFSFCVLVNLYGWLNYYTTMLSLKALHRSSFIQMVNLWPFIDRETDNYMPSFNGYYVGMNWTQYNGIITLRMARYTEEEQRRREKKSKDKKWFSSGV